MKISDSKLAEAEPLFILPAAMQTQLAVLCCPISLHKEQNADVPVFHILTENAVKEVL